MNTNSFYKSLYDKNNVRRNNTEPPKKNEYYSKEWEFDIDNWQNIHPNFTSELIQSWQKHHFTYSQTQDWANAFGTSFNPQDYEFVNWLANTKNYSAETALNQANLEDLKQEFLQSQPTAQIQQTNLSDFRNNS